MWLTSERSFIYSKDVIFKPESINSGKCTFQGYQDLILHINLSEVIQLHSVPGCGGEEINNLVEGISAGVIREDVFETSEPQRQLPYCAHKLRNRETLKKPNRLRLNTLPSAIIKKMIFRHLIPLELVNGKLSWTTNHL